MGCGLLSRPFLLTTAECVTNFSSHLHGMGWGITFFLLTTSNYVTKFSNHLHGVGWPWGGLGWDIKVFSTNNFQVRY